MWTGLKMYSQSEGSEWGGGGVCVLQQNFIGPDITFRAILSIIYSDVKSTELHLDKGAQENVCALGKNGLPFRYSQDRSACLLSSVPPNSSFTYPYSPTPNGFFNLSPASLL